MTIKATKQNESVPFIVPFPQNRHFVGQSKSREALEDVLDRQDGQRRLAVWGMSGIG
jgi:hypothetical protein